MPRKTHEGQSESDKVTLRKRRTDSKSDTVTLRKTHKRIERECDKVTSKKTHEGQKQSDKVTSR